jgi:ribosome-associated protein
LHVAIEAAQSRKATDVIVLDLKKTAAFTDYFLICTGANARQVQAIADAVEDALKAKKIRPTHVEGHQRAEWILLDYFDFVVHVFSTHARQFYGLERLWGEATRGSKSRHVLTAAAKGRAGEPPAHVRRNPFGDSSRHHARSVDESSMRR